jgi:hypothetical protein
MMNTPFAQQGVVLVFSLIMLLLITLLGTNMILQNRLQLMMVANSQSQATAFANVEDLLQLSESYIASSRYDPATWPLPSPIPTGFSFVCQKDADLKFTQLQPGDITDRLPLSQAMLNAGATVEIKQTACLQTGVTEIACTWTGDTTDVCYRSDQSQCPTEIYTLLITALDASTGSQRMIESKYAVRCDS